MLKFNLKTVWNFLRMVGNLFFYRFQQQAVDIFYEFVMRINKKKKYWSHSFQNQNDVEKV